MNLLKIHKAQKNSKISPNSLRSDRTFQTISKQSQLFVLTRPSELALFKREPRCSLTTELKPSGFEAIYSSAVANQLRSVTAAYFLWSLIHFRG